MFYLHPKLIDFDLKRLKFLMDKFDNPQNNLNNVIHIAGTNGKGSTATFLKEILEAHDLSVNIYTSPHLINFNERIRINKNLISDENLINILEEIELKNNNNPITFFEITTAAAFVAFKQFPSDINIFETGLGGRLDATNIIENKKLTIITKIGFDHEEFLGNKIEKIAKEKAGILRKNIPVIIAKQSKDLALKTLVNNAKELNSNIIQIDKISKDTKLGLVGDFQYENASTAFTAAKFLIPSISLPKVKQGLARTSWSGRIHRLTDGKIFNLRKNITVIDGSHNLDGAIVLNQYLKKQSFGKWNLIIGMLNNREIKDFVNIFKNHINQIYAIAIPEQKNSLSALDIKNKLDEFGFNTCTSNSLENALKKADDKIPLLITGSLYLAGYALKFNETIID
jgi:dihydrofolate synthase/folylpolyglutamate synthase